jgi:Na+-driven multidrug efflux pump
MAVNVIVMRIDGFVMMPIFSFGNAMMVYTGQNVGAGKMDRVIQGVKQCMRISVGTSIVLVTIILIFGRFVAGWFTDTQEALDLTIRMLRILAFGYITFSASNVLWGLIRGAGDAISPLWASVINSVIIRLPTAYLFVHLMGRPDALMYSLVTSWTAGLIFSIIIFKIGKWRTKGLVHKIT